MIKIADVDKELRVEGHSLPDICASVSCITTTIINCLLELCNEGDFSYEYDSGNCVIKIIKDTPITTKLYNILVTELKDLEEDFPQHVEFEK